MSFDRSMDDSMNGVNPEDSRALVTASRFLPPRSYMTAYEVEPAGIRFHEILGAARRNWWLILTGILLALGAVLFLLYREEPVYRAEALIRMMDTRGSITGAMGSDVLGPVASTVDPLLSEIMVLEGRGVLGAVVEREGFLLFDATTDTPATFVEGVSVTLPPESTRELYVRFGRREVSVRSGQERRKAAYGVPIELEGIRFTVPSRPRVEEATLVVLPRERAIDYLQTSIEAEPREGTSGIDVVAVAPDPRTATRIVNAVVQVHQEASAQAARRNATRRRAFFEEQLRETDSLLAAAATALSGFRSREQAYSTGERFSLEQRSLVELEMRQEELKAQRGTYQSLLDQILVSRRSGGAGELDRIMSLPGITDDPVVTQLYGQLIQYQSAQDSMLTGPWARAATHPDVERLDSMIASTEERLIQAAGSHVSSVDAHIEALDRLRGRSASEMSQLSGAEVEELKLIQQLSTLRKTNEQLRAEHQAARIEEAVEGGDVQIVHLASRAFPVDTYPAMKLMLGLLTGLLLGGGCAFLRENLNTSINRREEIEGLLQVPNLAVVPKIKLSRRARRRGAIPGTTRVGADGKGNGKGARAGEGFDKVASRLDLLDAEAYRILRTNLIFSRSQQSLKTLVVTSAAPKEGKTFTAVNLAAVCAQQGFRVLLMDCDLRRPSLARFFGPSEGPTLTSLLREWQDPRGAIRPSGIDGLDVLPATASFSNASELLGSPAMKRLLEELSRRYDMLILDSPPLLLASDAAVLGARADGVLLVIRAGSTDRGAAERAMDQLTAVGAHVVGAVLNDPDSTLRRYGDYHHNYAYSEPRNGS